MEYSNTTEILYRGHKIVITKESRNQWSWMIFWKDESEDDASLSEGLFSDAAVAHLNAETYIDEVLS